MRVRIMFIVAICIIVVFNFSSAFATVIDPLKEVIAAANRYFATLDLGNPETLIMGTQYDRRLGSEAESIRLYIYDYIQNSIDQDTEAYYRSFSDLSDDDYCSLENISDEEYMVIEQELKKLRITPTEIVKFMVPLSYDVYMFQVGDIWYYYDTLGWEDMMLDISSTPIMTAKAADDVSQFYGDWLMVGFADTYGRKIVRFDRDTILSSYASLDENTKPYLTFQQDGTYISYGDRYNYEVLGDQIVFGETPDIYGYRFISDNTLFIITHEEYEYKIAGKKVKIIILERVGKTDTQDDSTSIILEMPSYRQQNANDGGFAVMSMVEAYLKGYGDNDYIIYNNVRNYLVVDDIINYDIARGIYVNDPNGRNCSDRTLSAYSYLVISDADSPLDYIYEELLQSKPVIIRRSNGHNQHWGVVYGYEGSGNTFMVEDFMVKYTWEQDVPVQETALASFLQGVPEEAADLYYINLLVFLDNGINEIPNMNTSD